MTKVKTIIVCAYALYPEIKSSEGIVNKNWIDIIAKNYQTLIVLASAKNQYFINNISKKNTITTNWKLKLLSKSLTNKKNLKSFVYKILDKLFLFSNKDVSFNQFLWSKIQYQTIKNSYNKLDRNTIFWVRIHPVFSIKPVLKFYKKQEIPFIININDPIEIISNNQVNYEEQIFLETINYAQCWTFPSQRLAKAISDKYKLDQNRCFVIPHAMPDVEILYKKTKSENQKLNFYYTGTFYKSAFSEMLCSELIKFFRSEESKKIEFTFILSQFDQDSLEWIKTNFPNSKILTKLSREQVLEITSDADCMLVLDSVLHQDLLKGKLIEAISQGIPVFAITYQDSVMDKVVNEYGSISSYQNVQNDISDKLSQMIQNISDDKWLENFYENRKTVLEKISEKNIAKITNQITEFALYRFLWQQKKLDGQPEIPKNSQWP